MSNIHLSRVVEMTELKVNALKVIVCNENESRVVESIINLLNGGQSCNICKNYDVYDTYPRFVFGNSEFINTFSLESFNKIDNTLVTIDELRTIWMKHNDSGFTDLAKYGKDYDYSKFYTFRVTWLHRHVDLLNKEVCNIEKRVLDIEAHDVIHATNIWRDRYANENAANIISCEKFSLLSFS